VIVHRSWDLSLFTFFRISLKGLMCTVENFLQEPAESSGCGEEEGSGGVWRQVSQKLWNGVFLNAENCPCAGAPRQEQIEFKTLFPCAYCLAGHPLAGGWSTGKKQVFMFTTTNSFIL